MTWLSLPFDLRLWIGAELINTYHQRSCPIADWSLEFFLQTVRPFWHTRHTLRKMQSAHSVLFVLVHMSLESIVCSLPKSIRISIIILNFSRMWQNFGLWKKIVLWKNSIFQICVLSRIFGWIFMWTPRNLHNLAESFLLLSVLISKLWTDF